MNEIDFSLERLDFALRRRFVWFFFGYNPDTLKDIIRLKKSTLKSNIKDEETDEFISEYEAYIKKGDEALHSIKTKTTIIDC